MTYFFASAIVEVTKKTADARSEVSQSCARPFCHPLQSLKLAVEKCKKRTASAVQPPLSFVFHAHAIKLPRYAGRPNAFM